MRTGESLTIKSRDYTLQYIRPCTMEKGKKMAKLTIKKMPKDFYQRLEQSDRLCEVKSFPDLGVSKIRLKGKHIMVFKSGEISIRAAENKEDVLKTCELLVNILKT